MSVYFLVSTMRVIDDKTNGLVLRNALPAAQKVCNAGAFLDFLATDTLPMNGSPQLRRQVALAENVIGNVGEFLEPHVRIKLDTLGNDRRGSVVLVDVGKPNSRWDVLDNESQSSCLA